MRETCNANQCGRCLQLEAQDVDCKDNAGEIQELRMLFWAYLETAPY